MPIVCRMNHDLIKRIEHYAARSGLSPATVTQRAVGNSKLYARLCAGGSVTIRVADRLLAYMDGQEAAE